MKAIKARYYLQNKNYQKAIPMLKEGIAANPYLLFSENLLGKAYFEMGKIDSAFHYSKQAFYGLPRDIPRRVIPSLDFFHLVPHLPLGGSGAYRIVFAIQMLTYHLALIPLLLRSRADIYYTRDSLTAALLILIGKGKTGKVFFEAMTFDFASILEDFEGKSIVDLH